MRLFHQQRTKALLTGVTKCLSLSRGKQSITCSLLLGQNKQCSESEGRVAMVREKIWKMKFFPDQVKIREFLGRSGKFRKDLESREKVRKFENKWLWQADFRKFMYFVQEGKAVFSHEIV